MKNCEVCAKKNLWQSSQYWTDDRRWWQCRNCANWQLEVPPQGLKIPPKVLYFDIETALMKVDLFDLYVPGKRLSWKTVNKRSFVICWAATWVQQDMPLKVVSDCVTQREAKRGSDKRCLTGLFELMDAADYVVGHNSKAFDCKKVNTRFIHNKMGSPLEYKSLDTLQMARKHFKEDSNALERWSTLLGGSEKDDMRMEDWKLICDHGDPASLRKMERYNRGDVRNGVRVFQEFTKWIESSGKVVFR